MPTILKIRCRKCGAAYRTKADYAGKRTRCPKCRQTMVLPQAAAIEKRKGMRAVVKEGTVKLDLTNELTRSGTKPFCRVVYTEADPVTFALKRSDLAPLLDLSEDGIGFHIRADLAADHLAPSAILPIEIDFPVLTEPLTCRVRVRWTKPTADRLVQVGASFYKVPATFHKIMDELMQYILSRPDVWEMEEIEDGTG